MILWGWEKVLGGSLTFTLSFCVGRAMVENAQLFQCATSDNLSFRLSQLVQLVPEPFVQKAAPVCWVMQGKAAKQNQ